MKELNGISGINWKSYTLVKSSSNYPALEQSISGMYKMANLLFWGSLSFSVLLLALLLSLWINARRKEVGILLSIGLKQASILGQFITESILIAIPALVSAYFLATYTARAIGNTVLANVTSGVAKQASKAAQASNLGGGAEVDGLARLVEPRHFHSDIRLCHSLCSSLGSSGSRYGACFKQSPQKTTQRALA